MKALLLLSGGIDSPVAGKTMQEQGADLIALHFHTQPFTDETSVEKSVELAEILGLEKLYVVPFGEQSSEIVKECNHKYYYLLTRRVMWRIAERIAEKEGCDFLVTGENLGQVSSQTLDNLTVIDDAVEVPVLRPLLGNDKMETVKVAEEIGTYETSKGPEMCDALGPDYPATRADVEEVLEEEEKIEVESIISGALNDMEIKELVVA